VNTGLFGGGGSCGSKNHCSTTQCKSIEAHLTALSSLGILQILLGVSKLVDGLGQGMPLCALLKSLHMNTTQLDVGVFQHWGHAPWRLSNKHMTCYSHDQGI
jgi:hypothetical protein